MKNYKFAWCTVGFTMCLPLFIQHDIGFWLGAGFMLSIVVFFCSLVAKNANEAIANGAKIEPCNCTSRRTNPAYSFLPYNIWYRTNK